MKMRMKTFHTLLISLGAIPLLGGDVLDIVKNDLLKSDPYYIQNHREDALLVKFQTGGKENTALPKRIPDKYLTIFIYPYVDSNDAYHDETSLTMKYKNGEWIYGDKINLDEMNDVEIDQREETFSIVKVEGRS